jgi:mRNA interferase RelE/StbE
MNIEFRSSFLKDVKKVKSKITVNLIKLVIENCKNASNIAKINHCEALQSHGKFYKIKRGQYRFGVFIDNGIVEFLKFGTRQNFYDDFPPF